MKFAFGNAETSLSPALKKKEPFKKKPKDVFRNRSRIFAREPISFMNFVEN